MTEPTTSDQERERLEALGRLALLESPADQAFDDVVAFACASLKMPMGAFSLVDRSRQWFKASVGLDVSSTDRKVAFCGHVVSTGQALLIHDASLDERFSSNPLVTGAPGVVAYAGVPVHFQGLAIGSLCVIDRVPHAFTDDDVTTLRFLARQVEHLVDLHARRRAELPPSLDLVTHAADAVADGVDFEEAVRGFDRPAMIYDHATLRFLAVNDLAARHYGWSASEFTSRTLLDIRSAEDAALLKAMFDNSEPLDPSTARVQTARVWQHIRSDGETIDVKVVGWPTLHRGRPAQLVVITDVSTQIVLSGALERAAHSDGLTGLANRREFVRRLAEQLHTAGGEGLAVAFIDLDRFKLVNDTTGHDAGDALLAAAAARILRFTPLSALVARLGGDEFAVMYEAVDRSEAVAVAETIRVQLEQSFVIDNNEFIVTASIGVAVAASDSTQRGLLSEADAAMYAAKDSGRNACVVFDDHLRAQMVEWSNVQRDLHRALEEGQLEMFVQPIFALDDERGLVGREALVRWNHPTRGLLMPGSFIQVAEESGQIVQLGEQLLELGAASAAETGTPVTVNLSVRQFTPQLVTAVAGLIERHGLPPGHLVIEVTESAIIDAEYAETILQGLRRAGAHIWIDDFGTGFSSLARLGDLTVDGLKLDRRFIADLDSARGRGIATAIMGIARALEIIVVAEGVETQRQLDQVIDLGCHAAQGYLLGYPERSQTATPSVLHSMQL